MTTANTAVNSTTASVIDSLNSTKPATNSAQETSDRFMKLLVAQLNNQDPTNPMDSSQMTSQLAQINTASGIQTLNESIKAMSAQFTSLQVLQGASMIGREVLTNGNTLSMNNGVARGALDLSGNADKVTVQVFSPGGQPLDTLNLGTMTAGRHGFDWTPPASYNGVANPTFKVTASQGAKPVAVTPLSRNFVESVSTASGALSLTLRDGTSVTYDGIQAIL